jgi:hypothetical protein
MTCPANPSITMLLAACLSKASALWASSSLARFVEYRFGCRYRPLCMQSESLVASFRIPGLISGHTQCHDLTTLRHKPLSARLLASACSSTPEGSQFLNDGTSAPIAYCYAKTRALPTPPWMPHSTSYLRSARTTHTKV